MRLVSLALLFGLLTGCGPDSSGPPPSGPTYAELGERYRSEHERLERDLDRFLALADTLTPPRTPADPLEPALRYFDNPSASSRVDPGGTVDFLDLLPPGEGPRWTTLYAASPGAPPIPFVTELANHLYTVRGTVGGALKPDANPDFLAQRAPEDDLPRFDHAYGLPYLGAVRFVRFDPPTLQGLEPVGGLGVMDGLIYDREAGAIVCAVRVSAGPQPSAAYVTRRGATEAERAEDRRRMAETTITGAVREALMDALEAQCGGTFGGLGEPLPDTPSAEADRDSV